MTPCKPPLSPYNPPASLLLFDVGHASPRAPSLLSPRRTPRAPVKEPVVCSLRAPVEGANWVLGTGPPQTARCVLSREGTERPAPCGGMGERRGKVDPVFCWSCVGCDPSCAWLRARRLVCVFWRFSALGFGSASQPCFLIYWRGGVGGGGVGCVLVKNRVRVLCDLIFLCACVVFWTIRVAACACSRLL